MQLAAAIEWFLIVLALARQGNGFFLEPETRPSGDADSSVSNHNMKYQNHHPSDVEWRQNYNKNTRRRRKSLHKNMSHRIKKHARLVQQQQQRQQLLSLETTYEGGTGQSGNMFDIVAKTADVTIYEMNIHSVTNAYTRYEIWTREGSYIGHENSSYGWTMIGCSTLLGAGKGMRTNIPTFAPIDISTTSSSSSNTKSVYITLVAPGAVLQYTPGTAGGGGKAVAAENDYLQILEGAGKTYPFYNTYPDRIWNGVLYFGVGGVGSNMLDDYDYDEVNNNGRMLQISSSNNECLPTAQPSQSPSDRPTRLPSIYPSDLPSDDPSSAPSIVPSLYPSPYPSWEPNFFPSYTPSYVPSIEPSEQPSREYSRSPSISPSNIPSLRPTSDPTRTPTAIYYYPSDLPSELPSEFPSDLPSIVPSIIPTFAPSLVPSDDPTYVPSVLPSGVPSVLPSQKPSMIPSVLPSVKSTTIPTPGITLRTTLRQTQTPTITPTNVPTTIPTIIPSEIPTNIPTIIPSEIPTLKPSNEPTIRGSNIGMAIGGILGAAAGATASATASASAANTAAAVAAHNPVVTTTTTTTNVNVNVHVNVDPIQSLGTMDMLDVDDVGEDTRNNQQNMSERLAKSQQQALNTKDIAMMDDNDEYGDYYSDEPNEGDDEEDDEEDDAEGDYEGDDAMLHQHMMNSNLILLSGVTAAVSHAVPYGTLVGRKGRLVRIQDNVSDVSLDVALGNSNNANANLHAASSLHAHSSGRSIASSFSPRTSAGDISVMRASDISMSDWSNVLVPDGNGNELRESSMLRESFLRSKFDAIEEGLDEDTSTNNEKKIVMTRKKLNTEVSCITEMPQPWWQIMGDRVRKMKKRKQILSKLESLSRQKSSDSSSDSSGGEQYRNTSALWNDVSGSTSSWWRQRAEELNQEKRQSCQTGSLDGNNEGGEGYGITG